MGIFNFGKKSSKTTSSSSSESFVDPMQQGYLGDIYSRGQQLSNNQFPVEGVAALNPTQTLAMDNRFNAGGNIMNVGGMIQNQGMSMMPGQTMALNYAQGAMGQPAGFAGPQRGIPRGGMEGAGIPFRPSGIAPGNFSTASLANRAPQGGRPAGVAGGNFSTAALANRAAGQGGGTTPAPQLPPELQRISQFNDLRSRDMVNAFYADPEAYYAQRGGGAGAPGGMPSNYASMLNARNPAAPGPGGMIGPATVGPMNMNLASNMASRGAIAGPAQNTGINTGLADTIGGMTTFADAAQGRGIDTDTAGQATGMTTFADAAQNRGFDQRNVSSYINNDVLEGQIDAASRDIMRNLTESQLTGNASGAAATGNSGSSRRAVMDAIAARGAADRVGDISAAMRGRAYDTGVNIEAGRAAQNAGFDQQTALANAGAANRLTGLGLNIAANQGRQNVGNLQAANLANAAAANRMQAQGVNVAANQASQDTANRQAAELANQNAYNTLLGQGFNFGNQQALANAGFDQQAALANQRNAQFGASLANTIGRQGVADMQAGANLALAGANAQQGVGNDLRAYEQQLLNNLFQQQMGPYNALNFFANLVGDPTILNKSQSQGTSKSKGFNIGFGESGSGGSEAAFS